MKPIAGELDFFISPITGNSRSSDSGGVDNATFILQIPNSHLPNAQPLNQLANGMLSHNDGVVFITKLSDGKIWIGDGDDNPHERGTISRDNLPDLTAEHVWRGGTFDLFNPDDFNRPLESLSLYILEQEMVFVIGSIVSLLNSDVAIKVLIAALQVQVVAALALAAAALPKSGGTMTGPLILYGDATAPLESVTLQQLTAAVISGSIFKPSCYAATTANLGAIYTNGIAGVGAKLVNAGTLSAFSIDSTSPPLHERVCIKDQSSTFQNGIYTVTVVGSGIISWELTRSTDYDNPIDIKPGDCFPIINGTINGGTIWLQSQTVITIGTDPILFQQFSYNATSFLQVLNNLSDLNNVATARLNLGLTNVAIQSLTNHSVLVGAASDNITSIAVPVTPNQILLSGASADPSWSTASYLNTTTLNNILYSSSANTIDEIATSANGVLITNAGGIPSIASILPSNVQTNITNVGTIGTGIWEGSIIDLVYGGTGALLVPSLGGVVYSDSSSLAILTNTLTVGQILRSGVSAPSWSTATYPSTTTINRLLYSSAANTIVDLATANNAVLITNGSGVPALSSTPSGLTSIGIGNISIGGNTISSTNTNGNIILSPNGIGQVQTTGFLILNADASNALGAVTKQQLDALSTSYLLASNNLSDVINKTTARSNLLLTNVAIQTLTNHSVLIGAASNAITSLAVPGIASQILMSGASSDPAWSTATYPSTTTINRLLYSSAANIITDLATANSGVLITDSGGIPSISSTLPSAVQGNITSTGTIGSGTWQATVIGLTYGGSGAALVASVGGVVYSTASAMAILSGTATARQMLQSGSSGAPAWSTATYPATTTINRLLYSSAANVITDLATANNAVLITNGSGVPALSSTPSGLTSIGIGNISIAGNTISSTDTNGNIILSPNGTGQVQTTGFLILNADATNALGAVTKQQLDAVAANMDFKDACYAATTANLNATYVNGVSGIGATLINAGSLAAFSVDGVSPPLNARILIKNQSSTFQNGIYTLTTIGSGIIAWILTRATDYDQPSEIFSGTLVNVNNGTINQLTTWIETQNVTTIGTDAIVFLIFNYSASSYLLATNNLSDVLSVSTSRTNLGLTNVAIQTLTNHSVLIGAASNAITSLAVPGTANQILLSGASADPAWSTATYPTTTTINRLLYSSSANVITDLATANSGVLITSAGGIPSISSTLPSAVQGNITSTGTIGSGTWQATVIGLTYGGSGAALVASVGGVVYSTASAMAILSGTSTARQMLQSGASAAPAWSTATYPATTTINRLLYSSAANIITDLATANSGVLITDSGGIPSISSTLPSAVQGNITSTGTIGSGTWQATVIGLTYGGSGAALVASVGGVVYSTASAMAILSGTATARQILQSGASGAPAWSTATYPATTTINRLLYSSAANVITDLATANSGVLITDNGGIPSISSTLPSAVQTNITSVGTVTTGTWSANIIDPLYNNEIDLISEGYSQGSFGSSLVGGKCAMSANTIDVYDTTAVNANSKGFKGAVFDGRYIYFVPNNSSSSGQITRYDTTGSFTASGSYAVYDTTAVDSNSKGFYGGIFDGRYVYFVPNFHGASYFGQITRYDTTGSFTAAGSYAVYDTTAVNANSKGFAGAVFDGRYIYFVPDNNGSAFGQITRYDTTASFTAAGSYAVYDTTAVNANSKGFVGAVFDGRYIYFVPNFNTAVFGQITRYDTTGSFTAAGSYAVYDTTAVNANSKGFAGGVYDGKRYIYFVPYYSGVLYSGQITRYDTTASFTAAGSYAVYDTTAVNANSKGFVGAVFDGRYIYFVPLFNASAFGQITQYDTTGSFTAAGSYAVYDTTAVNANSKGFIGGVYDGRYIYLSPSDNGAIFGQITRIRAYRGAPAVSQATNAAPNGIQFPVVQASSVDLNTLDDYIESTFTPTMLGTFTFTTQTGTFTKIGNRVFLEISLVWSARTSTASNIQIGILPYLPTGQTNVATLGNMKNVTIAGVQAIATCASGASYLSLFSITSAGTSTQLIISNLGATGQIDLSMVYITAT